MNSEEYFAKRNGGKTPKQMEDDGEFVGVKWCQKLMADFAKHKTAKLKQRLETRPHETIVNWRKIEDEKPEPIEGNKVLGFGNGYVFECEYEDGLWCNIGGETMTHWKPLDHPTN